MLQHGQQALRRFIAVNLDIVLRWTVTGMESPVNRTVVVDDARPKVDPSQPFRSRL
ncbi:hypothetical protein NSU_0989 [Novosphingobium pentaromativorans US6-1]|uniref:Uncharacterized protein n=1 Tax=Novosphingobium pentaromativorans US6-1 TaxID=1088721 RepID=G6E9G8_9SPHN|nr:hypothetical protein NSU_0989 [Novosphingobium pentaromativorans US6-1]